MILSLKQAFLKEGYIEKINVSLDLSDPEDTDDVPLKDAVEVDAVLKNTASAVQLTGKMRTILRSVCARCMEDVAIPYEEEFSHLIVKDVSSDENEADFVISENDEINLSELLRSDLLLSLPSRIYCKPSCKGLCPICGTNLNTGKCSCVPEEFGSNKKLSNLSELLNKQDK